MSMVISGSGTITGLSAGGLPNDSVTSASIASLAATKLTGQVPDANAPSGSVIQVVQGYATPTFSTTSTSFIDYPSASVSITPTNTANKVLVLVNFSIYAYAGGDDNGFKSRIVRDSTAIYSDNNLTAYIYSGGATEAIFRTSMSYVDSPATTSATTYKLQIACTVGSSLQNYDNNPLSIIAMEIAG